jgi:Icc-related predicted phosphoesterase
MENVKDKTSAVTRVAATADLHFTHGTAGSLRLLFTSVNAAADVFAICGDLTDHGLPEEAQALAKELTGVVRIPVVAVLGNHDYESGKHPELKQIFQDSGIHVLDGETFEFMGIGFAGIKGFAGGFDRHALGPWGEDANKRFVHAAVDESLKLESALARLRSAHRIALLHYSPVRATVEGEPLEIFPFLGSSRLEEPINRYAPTAVFHGHAHHGNLEGRTATQVPVYNVSMRLLQQQNPDQPPFRILKITTDHDSLGGDRKEPGSRVRIRTV